MTRNLKELLLSKWFWIQIQCLSLISNLSPDSDRAVTKMLWRTFCFLTLHFYSEGQRARWRICLLHTEISSCLVKDIKQHCKWSFSLSFPPSNSLYVCIWISLPFILYPPIWIYGSGAEAQTLLCVCRDGKAVHTGSLSRQTRWISFHGDAINLDFISKMAVKERRAGDEPR